MEKSMKRCLGCMEEYSESHPVCPHCGCGDIQKAAAFHLNPGTMLEGRYLIGKALGAGNFGVTYIGWDSVLEQKVAIKEYLPGDCSTRVYQQKEVTVFSEEKAQDFKEGMEQFVQEAKRLAKLQNITGIVQVYDSFYANETAYIVMEYLQGETLNASLKKQGKMPVKEATEIVIQVLQALTQVHKAGILHRDIAPDNIFITSEGKVKLLDFGAARFVVSQKSKSLSVILKAGYSPIEQYTGKGKQGPWTDVYAVAATFYKMITGITPDESMERAVKDTLQSPSSIGIKISKGIEHALHNALNVNAENRTQTAEQFLEELCMAKVALKRKKRAKEDIGSWTRGWVLATASAGISIILFFVGVTIVRAYDTKTTVEVASSSQGQRVPDVRNLLYEDAREALEEKGFIVETSEDISLVIPEGYVMAQEVKPGTAMAQGETVALTVSTGAKVMPDVREFVLEDALVLLDTMEIEYEVVEEENPEIAPGAIISQSVVPNERVEQDSIILKVAVSSQQEAKDETIQVEDFTGRLYEEVKNELREKGVYLAKYALEYHDDLPMGSIVAQRVTDGSEIGYGEVIAVAVNVGFTQITVPDVTGKAVEEATEILKKSGMLVTLTYENSTEVAVDNIITQDIAGQEKVVGTNITLCVSLGKKKEVIDWTTDASLVNSSKYTCETKTEYRYQTRTKNVETTTSTSSSMSGWTMTGSSQIQGDWGAWSGWSQSAVSGSDTRQVETRESVKHGETYDYIITEYRYRDRKVQTNYHFQREVYSDWSEWSAWQQNAVEANDCTNVESRTLYRYTEK